MADTKVVTKSLICGQDLLHMAGVTQQNRANTLVEAQGIFVPIKVGTEAQLTQADARIFNFATLVTNDGSTQYKYSETDTSGVPSIYGGSWVKDIILNGDTKLKEDLAGDFGSGLINNVVSYIDFTTKIKTATIPPLINFIYTKKYKVDSLSVSNAQLQRYPTADNVLLAGTDWLTNGLISRKALVFDLAGKAFMLMPVNGSVSVESLGGGDGNDDSVYLELALNASTKQVRLEADKIYNFTRPVKHSGCKGWKGSGTTILGPATGARCPFISSTQTAQGLPNDVTNGTTGVANAKFSGLTIDTNYTDITGGAGFLFAENTLDNWTDCKFSKVKFKNSKFDNLALQFNCLNVTFDKCKFENAGEDSVTVRKTCERIVFRDCDVTKTALVAHSGTGDKFGDGIVSKGKFVLITGGKFTDVGNGIKGAAIACNAEDNDTAFQASYLTVSDCEFVNCYGGLGFGTVNASMIAAGQLIEGIVLTNLTFINTKAIAIGLRYLRDVKLTNCAIIAQDNALNHAVELINVINLDGRADVRTAQGGGVTINNCTGSFAINMFDVSKASAVNSVVASACDGLKLDINLNKSGRTGMNISTFSNGKINAKIRDCALVGVILDDVRRSSGAIDINSCANNGFTGTVLNENDFTFNIADVGTATNALYASFRYVSGANNRFKVISTSGQVNKPSYDLLVEAGTSRSAIYYIANAGVTGAVNQIAGSTAKLIDELV